MGRVSASDGISLGSLATAWASGLSVAAAALSVADSAGGGAASNVQTQGMSTEVSEASTPVGRLGSPMNTEGVNAAETVNGIDYSGHALDRMQSVGLTPSIVEDAIQNGFPGPGNTPGTATLTTDQLRVVINSDNQVVTIYPQ